MFGVLINTLPPGSQNPGNLSNELGLILYMLYHLDEIDGVKAALLERQKMVEIHAADPFDTRDWRRRRVIRRDDVVTQARQPSSRSRRRRNSGPASFCRSHRAWTTRPQPRRGSPNLPWLSQSRPS
jgi:hypothetical protein